MGLKDCQGPPGCEGPAGLSLSPEVYEECLAALRQGRIDDDERRANVWWRRLGRKLRSMTKSADAIIAALRPTDTGREA